MNKRCRLVLLLLAVCLTVCACTAPTDTNSSTQVPTKAQEREVAPKLTAQSISELPLTDDRSLYAAYDPSEPVCFYVTVVGGNAADETDHTLEQVHAYKNLQGMTNVEKIKTEIIFQVGDETGPLEGEIGYHTSVSNATLNVRGRTSTGYPQKSYRIDLFDNAGLWRGQRALALNKHPGDPTRLRNMLYFELLQDVPAMTSLRTQFVHLYVMDKTAAEPETAFRDYGLYTQVELPNGRYLRNHGLSRDGNLYKANLCEMFRYEDKLRLATDPLYDAAAFAEVLEPKTSNDHQKLLRMLDAVNDDAVPIEQVIDRYFDLDNLTSYLAFNMLMANPDSNAQNYLLYSPVNSEKWYYLCWDGDGALSIYEDELLNNQWTEADWTKGVSCYWSVKLFNRMLKVDAYRQALFEKVELLHTQLTPEKLAGLIAKYRQTVDRFTTVMPDAVHMQLPQEKLEAVYENMPYDVEKAYEHIMASFEKPMPFYMDDAAASGNELWLSWGAAYDFDGEFIRYDVQVATDWSFAPEAIVFESKEQLGLSAHLPMPPAGTYFWRVVAHNESNETQIAFDQVITSTGAHGGMRQLVVSPDGTVSNPL